nr:putative ribonuclease h protein [Quercus suber]
MPTEFILSLQPDEGHNFGKVKHVASARFWYRIQGEHYKIDKLGDLELLERLRRLQMPTSQGFQVTDQRGYCSVLNQARVVCESSPLWGLFCNSQHQNFEEVTKFILQLDQPEVQELFAIIAWSLWFCRKEIRVNELDKVPHDVVSWANNFRLEFQSMKEGTKVARPKENLKWVPPPQGWFKANVDGAIFKVTNSAGIGVAVRDCQGWVLAALSEKVEGVQEAEVIETLAIRRPIRFAIETSFNCVIIESDSLGVVKAIQDSADSTCHIGHIIEDVKQLAKVMKNCDFHHTKREAKQVAHTLARNAIHVDTVLAWLEEIPPCVSHVIHLDAL